MRYEASDQVFIAMPFSAPFQRAFDKIIEPAISKVQLKGKPLRARIINRATAGSPDIHEQIYDAILHSRLVLADMTVQCQATGDDGVARWQANANVAYEVGLASAWRNPEDVLLVHQGHSEHRYSFDVQNLRHVQYDTENPGSIDELASEIARALNQSSFLSKVAYQKLVESVSPSAVQYMHQEARRAFPVIAFNSPEMPLMDARIHAATELLSCGALKNRNVLPQGQDKGVAVIYEWTELGLRMLLSLRAVTESRARELRTQIDAVAPGAVPPPSLRDFPAGVPATADPIDMVKAAQPDSANDAATR